ncbi:HAD-IB family hydrolase [Marinobacterium sp. AK62]|uniref:HAD-IB family hydrolase n=1 Tax=Marinobacterium alkalitolerans TaxID=1542925 RepID=A0ABS3ZAE4_9GAMM|nr:HAD family hydrolase [Marinobacterium alkalitolerans]MBP0048330.1 HAD-IB family hydrolase [Marinobacterium alkalitolerans]
MKLAIFDLDETLVGGDTASLFCAYLVEQGLAGPELLVQEAELMQAYARGTLDMAAYIRVMTAPVRHLSAESLQQQVDDFVCNRVLPRHFPQARERLDAHRRSGDCCIIISATADFIVHRVAAALDVPHALAIDLSRTPDGRLDGGILGTPSFREGKVQRLENWLQGQPLAISETLFYSDSRNDLPLLEHCDKPHVVNPDPELSRLARTRGWPILHWMRGPHTPLQMTP